MEKIDAPPEPLISLRTLAIGAIVILLVLSYIKPVSSDDSNDDISSSSKPSSSESKAKPGRKLQIGIKKRPETCDRKSKKGDSLHIHYRVSHDLMPPSTFA